MESIFDILECSVCLERLDATSKILPCQHTFCVRCLSTILKTSHDLRCPECREPVPVRDVSELPTNILLIRILDGLVKPTSGSNHLEDSPSKQSSTVTSGIAGKNAANVFKPTHPFARAKFKYEPKEAGDLSFNKGDIIFLKKKLDDNWYVGEVNNQMGFFPANHVEVIQPLVEDTPKCKALYDFEVAENEEKDILTFTKDEVLKVIRRVDDNWVEGQKGDKIGIFPISFVQFNDPAKSLIEGQQGGGSGDNSRVHHSPQGSGSSGEGSSQGGQGNSEQGASGVTRRQGGSRNKSSAKRHSFTSVLGVQLRPKDNQERTNGSNRHSMEISPPELVRSSNPIAATLLGARQQGANSSTGSPSPPPTLVVTSSASSNGATQVANSGVSRKKPPPLAAVPQVLLGGGSLPGSPSAVAHGTDSGSSPRPSVEVYKARYSYKPQNADELEVSAGEFFTVFEICTDGWFKGMSLSSGKVGVFPGNYMEPYRMSNTTRSSTPASPGVSTFFPLPDSSSPSHQLQSSSQPVVRPKQSQVTATPYSTSQANAATQATAGRIKGGPKPPTIMQQDCQKTVAQLQNERNRQQQLLREMAQKGTLAGNHGAPSRGSPPPLVGSPPVSRVVSDTPNIASGSRTSLRQGNRHRNLEDGRRLSSGTGIPQSVLDQMLHDEDVTSHGHRNQENRSHFPRNGYARSGARGRSKSASRISSKTVVSIDGRKYGSSPEEGTSKANGSSSPRNQVQRQLSVPCTPHHVCDIPPSSPTTSPSKNRIDRFRPRRYSEGERDAKRFHRSRSQPGPSQTTSPVENAVCQSECCACQTRLRTNTACLSPSHASHPNDYTASAFAPIPKATVILRGEKKEKREKTRRKSTSSDFPHPVQGPPPPVRTTPPLEVHHTSGTPIHGATGGSEMENHIEEERPPKTAPLARERYRVVDSYPAHSDVELHLLPGDIIFVHKKREDGWFKGTSQRNGKTGLFPGTFVEKL
ncbi:E3 ubiquitin-protein ligase SH3RF1 [Holothuria leucospilota]|uniref:E3 ubiquitin-protein ligase SH3RF1 n=1 Tax=Holothuria leucospilota TaxID=206669 RepID=A0A9Q1BK79_HOLLE|nr:E3 ubiquitin-protein ligase SH3RF1 [Holothuria leucospilota]